METFVRRVISLLPWAILFGILGAWEAWVHVFNTPHYILPAPSDIAVTLVEKRALLLKHSLVTLEEMLLGFALAAGIGIPLAVLMFEFPVLEKAFYPYVIGSQTVPVFAIAPLLVLWFGFGIASKVIMAALIVFFAMVLNTLDGLKSADPDTVNLCRILQASRWQILWKSASPIGTSVHLHRREDRHLCLHDWCGNRRMGGRKRGPGIPHARGKRQTPSFARFRGDFLSHVLRCWTFRVDDADRDLRYAVATRSLSSIPNMRVTYHRNSCER